MKHLLIIGLLMTCTSCTNVQVTQLSLNLSVPQVENITDTIAAEIGLRKLIAKDSMPIYITPQDRNPTYAFRALVQPYNNDSNIVKILTLYGFGEDINRKLNKTFKSYFEQEMNRDSLTLNMNDFTRLKPRLKSEMWKRNLINIGYGIHYSGIGHPYYEQWDGWFGVIFFGALDVAHYALIIAGPSIGETKQDGMQISLTGVVSLLAWKLMIPWMVNRKLINGYNCFADAKYCIPKSAISK